MLGKLRIGTLLGSLMGFLGLALVAICLWSVTERLASLRAAETAAALSGVDKRLFWALQAFRYERGDTASALHMPPNEASTLLNSIRDRRVTVDREIQEVLGASVPLDGWAQAAGKLRTAYDTLVSLRRAAEAELVKPAASRDARFVSSFPAASAAFMASIEEVALVLESRVQQLDPLVGQLLFAKRTAWEVRSSFGQVALNVLSALVEKRGFSPQEATAITALTAKANAFWTVTRDLHQQLPQSEALDHAMKAAQGGYFAGSFSDMQAEALRSLMAGSPINLAHQEFRAALTPALDTISAAAVAFVDQAVDTAEGVATTARVALIVYGGILLLAVVVSVGGFLIARWRVATPIVRITSAMETVSGGNLAADIPYGNRSDEIGEMAGALLIFRDGLAETERMRQERQDAEARAKLERKGEMEALADRFDRAVGQIVEMVSSAATELQAAASILAQSANETTARATAVVAAAEQASVNVQAVASAVEELSASAAEIGKQVTQSTAVAGRAVAEADETNSRITGLKSSAEQVGAVVGLIGEIAAQTNLLALNATIESARAGEAGRGFAVVAQEVKGLAEQTAKATTDISQQINGMQGSTGAAVTAIAGIGRTIGDMSHISSAIVAAVEEQGATTAEVARNVHHAAIGTQEVTSNIAGVTQAAQTSSAAATQVLASASELAKQSETLRAEVSRFLDTVRAAA